MRRRTILAVLAFGFSLSFICPLGFGEQAASGGSGEWPDAFTQNKRLGRGVNIIGYDSLWRDRSRARFRSEFIPMIRQA